MAFGCAADGVGGKPHEVSPAGTAGTTGTGTGGGAGVSTTCRQGASLASARINLLSVAEYTNIMRDVFQVEYVPETAPTATGEYPLDEDAQVASAEVAKQYLRAADQVAGKLKPCGDAALAAGCVESFLRKKLPRAWKRPVADAEIASLMAIFNGGLVDGGPRALSLLMEAALGAGAFVYETETGTDASGPTGSVAMTPYELANALSFALLQSVPDDALWAKAVDGTITQAAVLNAEVDRLLALPAVHENLTKKVGYYLNVEKVPLVSKDATAFPEFTATLQSSLYQSAKLFLNDLVWGGSLNDLFTSNKYYSNEEISRVYGLPPVQGSGLMPIELPPERNAGILTHPGLLASTNHHVGSDDIVHRGLWIYEQLVCATPLGAPPANALDVQGTFTGTERVKAQERSKLAQCGACHRFFDPFGFASLNFDVIGRYRTIDPGDNLPVVSTATIAGLGPDLDGPVSSMKDIADRLKVGQRVADCAVEHLAEYTLDHNPAAENSCAVQQIKDTFARSGKLPDLFRAILTSPAFATRDLSNH